MAEKERKELLHEAGKRCTRAAYALAGARNVKGRLAKLVKAEAELKSALRWVASLRKQLEAEK